MFRVDVKMPFGPGAYRVRMEGVLGANTELGERLAGLSGLVVVDLDGITRVTSFGIRSWMEAFSSLEASYYAFVHCRPSLLRQFNMIEGFEVRGQLVSFYTPQLCTACEEPFETLVDLRYETVSSVEELAPQSCPSCGAAAIFDEADDYLEFPASQPRPVVPPLAQQLIDSRGRRSSGKLTLTKRIEGDVTVVRLHGTLAAGPQLDRWLEGLEGTVRLDFTGVRHASPEGLRQLVAAVPGPPAGRALCEGVRLELCGALAEAAAGERAPEIFSILVPGRCGRCAVTVEALLGADGGIAGATCPQCGGRDAPEVPESELGRARSFLAPGAGAAPAPPPSPARKERPRAGNARAGGAPLPPGFRGLVAESPAFREIVQTCAQVALTDATILLRGETGTGKELIARHIHEASSRKDQPFVAVNCAALPEGLIESELFGHEEGAFTGASSQRIGRFERAHGGTLFIDEVGELPAAIQVKLLRALQERTIERIGGKTAIPIDIRLVAATHRNLEAMLKSGEFREDLFYRLNVVPIVLPPLRERPEDVLPLAEMYLEKFQTGSGKHGIRLSDSTRAALKAYAWPGNVRQLINVIERAVALTPSGAEAAVHDLSGEPGGAEPGGAAGDDDPAGNLKDAVEDYERKLILDALKRSGGNQSAAARLLGLSRQSLRHKILKYRLL